MEFKNLMPNLMVKNVGETVDFYKNVLGFNVVTTVPESAPFVFAIVNAGSVVISFQEEKSIKEEYNQLAKFPQGGGFTLYIHVTDVNGLYEKVKGKAKIAKEMHKTFYGSTDFAIEDCNGYILTFSQKLIDMENLTERMNTLEKLKENSNVISKQIEQIGIDNNRHFVIDGIIDPEKYLKAKYRILWILKEANSECDTWSYLENFKDIEWLYRCGKSIPTLRRMIYTTYGILRDCQWNEIPDASNEKSFEPLQEIAIINIKKIPGGGTSESSEIQQAYDNNRELLKQQIDTYDANIVIFGNTLRYFHKSDFEALETTENQKTEYGNVFYNTRDKLYIDTWHPAVRGAGFTDEGYVMDIVNIVKDWNADKNGR